MFMDFRERQRETLMWEKNISWFHSLYPLNWDGTCNLSMCPEWGSNLQLLVHRMMFQPTEPPGQGIMDYAYVKFIYAE